MLQNVAGRSIPSCCRQLCTTTERTPRFIVSCGQGCILLADRRIKTVQSTSVRIVIPHDSRQQNLVAGRPSMTKDITIIAKIAVPLVICGLLTAYAFPSHRLPAPWRYVSDAMGFTYTAAWSISFYPQFLLNFQRRSVIGLSIDFQVLNLLGFFCYATYNVALFFSPVVQQQYHDAFGPEIPVGLEDVIFSVHAVVITALTLIQCAVYERGEQKFDTLNGRLAAGVAGASAALCCAVAASQSLAEPIPHFTWINLLLALSTVKLVVSLIKYIPQVFLNIKRQSTEGWSIMNVLLDWLGGVLSVAQLVMQCAVLDDWRQIAGNPVKFGLGFVSLSFDVLFMVQHYVLYKASDEAPSAPDAVTLLTQGQDPSE
eukprot:jgi/Ulvmu1/4801/UM020_0086.1